MINPEDFEKFREKKRIGKYQIVFLSTFVIIYLLFQIFFSVTIVSGDSMLNTLHDKDIEISIRKTFCNISRGDIVNIKSGYLEEGIVKRVIGIAGDTVEIKDGRVYLNSQILLEDYSVGKTSSSHDCIVTVPQGQVFVLGDNREHSADSREIGCISEAEIESILLFSISR